MPRRLLWSRSACPPARQGLAVTELRWQLSPRLRFDPCAHTSEPSNSRPRASPDERSRATRWRGRRRSARQSGPWAATCAERLSQPSFIGAKGKRVEPRNRGPGKRPCSRGPNCCRSLRTPRIRSRGARQTRCRLRRFRWVPRAGLPRRNDNRQKDHPCPGIRPALGPSTRAGRRAHRSMQAGQEFSFVCVFPQLNLLE